MKKFLSAILAIAFLFSMSPAFAEGVVNVFNWEDYISEETLRLFTEETGIRVDYMNFTTNEDMLVQVRTQPGAFDVIFPSDYIVERLIAEDRLEELNFENIPNSNYTLDWLQNPAYDPAHKYSIPYMWGTVGILYNTTKVMDSVTSWDILWNENYKGTVFMLDSIRDTLGLALKSLGYSMNTRNPLEIEAAKQKLIAQKSSGMVKAYQVDETKDKMVAGEGALAVVWSGDAQYAIDLNPDLAYAIPEEGSNIWVDAMVIPKGAKNKENAEKFIDFMCRPDIAQLNSQKIGYSSPNTEAIKLMGEEYANQLTTNPPQELLDKSEFFSDIQDFIEFYNAIWLEVKNAK